MQSLRSKLQKHLPDIKFVDAAAFYWSPKSSSIYFNSGSLERPDAQWALLHEAGHAVKQHKSYSSDLGLLILEVEAWQAAQELAGELKLTIDETHVQDCLDTYRDWLYARSTCPACSLNSLQIDETVYQCLNCSTRWTVSKSRFCRPYRMKSRQPKSPPEPKTTVFR